jgi:hypothetical protein
MKLYGVLYACRRMNGLEAQSGTERPSMYSKGSADFNYPKFGNGCRISWIVYRDHRMTLQLSEDQQHIYWRRILKLKCTLKLLSMNHHHHHHHVHEGLGIFPVPWSSKWNWSLHLFLGRPLFLRPFGLYCNACFGILFVSTLCTCCSHFSWYCLFPLLCSMLPFSPIIHWFFSLFSFVIPSKCLKNFWTWSMNYTYNLLEHSELRILLVDSLSVSCNAYSKQVLFRTAALMDWSWWNRNCFSWNSTWAWGIRTISIKAVIVSSRPLN